MPACSDFEICFLRTLLPRTGLPIKLPLPVPSNLFHTLPMAKRKRAKFSATKAVKANARERVGQPRPSRMIDDAPRTPRQVKHKAKLEETIEKEE
jgi:hypothetical protein